jgi:hypothetical protein
MFPEGNRIPNAAEPRKVAQAEGMRIFPGGNRIPNAEELSGHPATRIAVDGKAP